MDKQNNLALKTRDVAKILGCKTDNVLDLVHRGILTPYRIGKRAYRYTEDDVISAIEKLRIKQSTNE